MLLEIKDLHADIGGKEVLNGIDLKVKSGELIVIMGPNGSGKTTLAKAIMGLSGVNIRKGDILVDGKSILGISIDERAKLGLFMQYQNPPEVEGVSFLSFLNAAKSSQGNFDIKEFMQNLKKEMVELGVGEEIIKRNLNVGFSGGEKKKSEMLQMALLKPKIAILDEPDSGLDVDAVRTIGRAISNGVKKDKMGCIVITHYTRILSYLELEGKNSIYVLYNGKFVAVGGKELAEKIEKEGYSIFKG
ncbi:MAG: Fe-S cluster assembly ATPase SufC [Candidatus Micrarchaeia archaeon]|jgi:Fe-S cluster assembly ATP-binding protein